MPIFKSWLEIVLKCIKLSRSCFQNRFPPKALLFCGNYKDIEWKPTTPKKFFFQNQLKSKLENIANWSYNWSRTLDILNKNNPKNLTCVCSTNLEQPPSKKNMIPIRLLILTSFLNSFNKLTINGAASTLTASFNFWFSIKWIKKRILSKVIDFIAVWSMNLHHGHGDLFEIIFHIPHVDKRLGTEYDGHPWAELVLQIIHDFDYQFEKSKESVHNDEDSNRSTRNMTPATPKTTATKPV